MTTDDIRPETREILDRCLETMRQFTRINRGDYPGGIAMHPELRYVFMRDQALAGEFMWGANGGTLFGIPLIVSPSITVGAIYALPDRAVDFVRSGDIDNIFDVDGRTIMYTVAPAREITPFGARPLITPIEPRILNGAVISMPPPPPLPDPEPQWSEPRDLDLDVEPLSERGPTSTDYLIDEFNNTIQRRQQEEDARNFRPIRRDLPIRSTPYAASLRRSFTYELDMRGGQPTAESIQSALQTGWNELFGARDSTASIMQIPQTMIGPTPTIPQPKPWMPPPGVELGGTPIPAATTQRQLDIIDEIDELVDEQMTKQPREWKYSAGDNCPYCTEPWHGLAITTQMREMRKLPYDEREQALLDYNYGEDTSDIICPGSETTSSSKYT